MLDSSQNSFKDAFNGNFERVTCRDQLDALWNSLREDAEAGWYIYTPGEAPPSRAVSSELLKTFLSEVDQLLRSDLGTDYYGNIFTDSFDTPQFVKIFDPGVTGVACSPGDAAPLPGWILSRLPPFELVSPDMNAEGQRSWWRRLLGS